MSVESVSGPARQRVVGLEEPPKDLLIAITAVTQDRHESRQEACHLVVVIKEHGGDHHHTASAHGE